MFLLMSGIVVFLITAAVFWALLPRGGNRHRWVDTEWEPYISVALCSGVAPSWVNINDIFRGVMPFMIIVIVSMIMLYTFPQIGLWLPNKLYH